MRTFEFRKVERQSEEIKDIFRLRYQVYCNEWGFEDPADYPEGLEYDEYDEYSVHFGAYLENTGEIIGTTRIIYDYPFDLPMEKNFTINLEEYDLDNARIGEISRFAVSKEFMRRATDEAFIRGNVDITDEMLVREDRRRLSNDMIAGLFKCIWNESHNLELTHWYAGMARSLHLILSRWKIAFHKIGPETDYHGIRGPYIGKIEDTRRSLSEKNPKLLKFFEDAGHEDFSFHHSPENKRMSGGEMQG